MRLFAWLCHGDNKISSGWPLAYLRAALSDAGEIWLRVAARPLRTGLHVRFINESH